jgi:uncharacterized protein (UPF0264 family)
MTLLLVSVRSVKEADIALRHGVDIVDVKEPARGSLGRADDAVLLAVQESIADRVPVTAALGELAEDPKPPPSRFTGLVKVGMSGSEVGQAANWLRDWPCQERTVLVAYADWERSAAPAPEAVTELAASFDLPGVLVDTRYKDGTRLLDWLSLSRLERLRDQAARHGLFLALAGSLRLDDVPPLLELEPDVLGFRGAACIRADRGMALDPQAVARLAEAVHASDSLSEPFRKSMTRTLLNRRIA